MRPYPPAGALQGQSEAIDRGFALTRSGVNKFSRTIVRQAMKKPYTQKQGQYLAFIHYYSKIYGRAPSEAEMQQYFRVSPPSVHQMVVTLEKRGLIERTPRQARSIRLLIA